jgi:SAM-dependent methyltransferase
MELIPKRFSEFPHISEHNWLIHALMIEFLNYSARRYAKGILVDIGCGVKPYESIFLPYVSRYVGIDLHNSPYGTSKIDLLGSAYQTNLASSFCDLVLCTEVLEHLKEPGQALKEFYRILKPNGRLILTVPFFWPIHEEPRDFFRYTEYGLKYLLKEVGYKVVEIKALSGYVTTFIQLSIYFMKRFEKGPFLKYFGRLIASTLQHIALRINRVDRSKEFTNLYGVIAKK